jgi:hypothetical protein
VSEPFQPNEGRAGLGRAGIALGMGDVLILLSLVLPWMSFQGGFQVGAFNGPGLLTFFAWIGMTLLFAAQLPSVQSAVSLPSLAEAGDRPMIIGGVVELVGVALFYPHYHGLGAAGVSRSVEFGFVVALAGSVLTIVAGVLARADRRIDWHGGSSPQIPFSPSPGPPSPPAPRSMRRGVQPPGPASPDERGRGSSVTPPPPPPAPRPPAGGRTPSPPPSRGGGGPPGRDPPPGPPPPGPPKPRP